VTVDPLTTTYTSPRLTGTVSDPTATVSVRVNGSSYSAVNNGDGTWTLAAGTITSLAVGTYDVAVTATDAVGNAGQDATLDELRVRAQTTMVLNFYGLWSVHYTDSDGTKVRVILNTLRKVPGGITLYFDSNSLITMRTDQRGRHAWIECDAGAELAALVVSQYSRGVSIKTSGGTVSGALLGGVSGEANLRVLSAPTVTLVGDGVYMPGSAIASVKLAAITDTTVTMFGLLTGGVTFKIGQSVSGSDIEVTDGDVSSFIVGSMVDSSLRVGTLGARDLNGDGVADLPSLDDFRSSHRIRRFTVTGYRGAAAPLFVNSNIAAEDLGAITLRDAQLNNQPDTVHEPFGLVGRSLRSLTLKQGVVTYRWLNGAWTPALDPLDLEIRLP